MNNASILKIRKESNTKHYKTLPNIWRNQNLLLTDSVHNRHLGIGEKKNSINHSDRKLQTRVKSLIKQSRENHNNLRHFVPRGYLAPDYYQENQVQGDKSPLSPSFPFFQLN